MTEEKKDPWMNWMSLATVILAVCATLSTFKGGSYSTQGVINQALASDQWAFYQAKSTKQHLYELQVVQLRLQALALSKNNAAISAYQQQIADDEKQLARYGQEKKEIEAKAHELEKERDEAKLHGRPFGLAVIFLQVAILLNSIAGLMKAKRVWWSAIPVGPAGIALFTNGFVGFF